MPSTKISPTLVLACLTVSLGVSFMFGYHIAKMNTPTPIIMKFLNETYISRGVHLNVFKLEVIWSLIISVFVISGAVGSFSSGWFANKLGRRRALLFNMPIAVVSSLMELTCRYFALPELLLFGRLLSGFNSGLNCGLAPLYLMEIAPVAIRGAVGNLHQTGLVVGIVSAQLLGIDWILGNQEYWPLLLGLVGLNALISFFTLQFCPESPRYLMLSLGDEEAARKSLMRFQPTSQSDQDKLIEDMKKEICSSTELLHKFSVGNLFTDRKLRMALLTSTILMVAQQSSGINAIFAFSGSTFLAAGLVHAQIQYAILGTGIINLVITLITIPMLEKLGRRALLIISALIIYTSMILITVTIQLQSDHQWMSYCSIVLMLTYIMGFASGIGPVPNILPSELFGQSAKGAAVACVQGTHWTTNFIVTFIFPFLQMWCGSFTFLIFTVVSASCCLIGLMFLPETKNRPIDEIVNDFRNGYFWIPCMKPRFTRAKNQTKIVEKAASLQIQFIDESENLLEEEIRL